MEDLKQPAVEPTFDYLAFIRRKMSELQDIDNIRYDLTELVEKLAHKLLEKLQKIDGWEAMIENCREHYKLYPERFFGKGDIMFGEDTIYFIKRYLAGDEYIVLRINTNIPLEEQVKQAVNKKNAE